MDTEWTIVFYVSADGRHSLRNEIKQFGDSNYAKILKGAQLLADFGLAQNDERVKHVEGKLWELRVDRFRVLYFAYMDQQFIFLKAFMKKTAKTPKKEIAIAAGRMDDYINRSKGDS